MIKARRVRYDSGGQYVGKSKPVDVWCCHNDTRKTVEVSLGLNKEGLHESVLISLKELLQSLGSGRCQHYEGGFTLHGKL